MKIYKLIGWYLLVALFSVLFWADINNWLNYSVKFDYGSYHVASVVYFVFLLSVLVIGFALFEKRWQAIIASGIITILYLVFFGLTLINLIGVALLIALTNYSQMRAREESTQKTKINSRAIISGSLTSIILPMFIMVSFAAYQSPAVQSLEKMTKIPSAGENVIKATVSKFVGENNISPSQKNAVTNTVTGEVMNQINSAVGPYLKYSPPIIAFALFLILWGFSWVFMWLSIFLGMLMFMILISTKFIKVETKDIKAEVIEI